MQSKSSALPNYEDYLTIFHAPTGAPVYVHRSVAEKMMGSGNYHSLNRHIANHQACHISTVEIDHAERIQNCEQEIRAERTQDEKGTDTLHVDSHTGCVRTQTQRGSHRLPNAQEEDMTCVDQYVEENNRKRGRPKKT